MLVVIRLFEQVQASDEVLLHSVRGRRTISRESRCFPRRKLLHLSQLGFAVEIESKYGMQLQSKYSARSVP